MNRNLPRSPLAILPLLLIPLILLVVADQLQRAPATPRAQAPQPPPEADYYLREAELSTMDAAGNLLYRVNAGNVLHYPDQSISLDQVAVDYLNGPWTLSAETGSIPAGVQTLLLSGNVKMNGTLSMGEDVQVSTSHIKIEFAQKRIETDAIVRMNSKTIAATATGLRTDLAGREIHLLSKVKVRYEP